MRKTKKGHRSRLAGHWNRRSPQPDQLERHILNFQSINSNEESPLMITWSHKANQKGFLRSKDETQLALSFYTRRIVSFSIRYLFSLAKGYVHRSLGPGTDRDGKGKAIVFTFFVCSPCSTHVIKVCKCAFRASYCHRGCWTKIDSIQGKFWKMGFFLFSFFSELTNKKWKAASLALGLRSSPS